jgi:hypothetical protein
MASHGLPDAFFRGWSCECPGCGAPALLHTYHDMPTGDDVVRVELHNRAYAFKLSRHECAMIPPYQRQDYIAHFMRENLRRAAQEISTEVHPVGKVSMLDGFEDPADRAYIFRTEYTNSFVESTSAKFAKYQAEIAQLTQELARKTESNRDLVTSVKSLKEEVADLKAKLATSPIPADFGRPAQRKLICA